MAANIDSVPFLVNYASDCAVGTTFMAFTLTNITYAGVSTILLSWTTSFQSSRKEHSCSAFCSAPGICEIDTTAGF